METKQCTKCKEVMHITNFVKDRHRPDGLAGNCKTCRKKNAEKIKTFKKDTPENKKCCRCGKVKDKNLFNKKTASYDGLESYCKQCRTLKYRERLKNKKYIKVENKVCRDCSIEKSIKCFHKNSSSKDGYSSQCKKCTSVWSKNYYENNKEEVIEKGNKYRETNREEIRARDRQKRIDNGDEIRRREREYRSKNRQKYRGLNKKWRDNNKEKLRKSKKEYAQNNKDVINSWVRKYKEENPLFKLGVQIRVNLWNNFTKLSKGKKVKSKRTEEILGCTMEEFKDYIERQFLDWMSWDNYGNCETNEYKCSWHLDHIVPISFARNEKEFYLLNHWSNFQPKCGKKNLEKNRSFIFCSNIELNFNSNMFKN